MNPRSGFGTVGSSPILFARGLPNGRQAELHQHDEIRRNPSEHLRKKLRASCWRDDSPFDNSLTDVKSFFPILKYPATSSWIGRTPREIAASFIYKYEGKYCMTPYRVPRGRRPGWKKTIAHLLLGKRVHSGDREGIQQEKRFFALRREYKHI